MDATKVHHSAYVHSSRGLDFARTLEARGGMGAGTKLTSVPAGRVQTCVSGFHEPPRARMVSRKGYVRPLSSIDPSAHVLMLTRGIV